jgi:hypothetical protein
LPIKNSFPTFFFPGILSLESMDDIRFCCKTPGLKNGKICGKLCLER